MSDGFHERVSAEFLKASALGEADRKAFLEALRGADPDLSREVESFLRHDAEPVSILEPGAPMRVLSRSLPAPARVGPYHVVEEVGRGGMGIVYRAERRDSITLEVALKLIKPGLETDRIMARFEAERRILALMDHHGIARVYDAGVSQGRPYVAMEFVRGEWITQHCDKRRLNVNDRLRLFLKVCDAVHHAHQNAIIHRDLKPSNVLVTEQNGIPVPKVIDFGIAKALSPGPQVGATLTVAGEFLGTPAYISPEQAMARPRNIDVRADVYSLGAMLYELLAGTPPFDPERLEAADVAEVRRILLFEEVPIPSRRLAVRGTGARSAVLMRRTECAPLAREVRGDLDAIVMKAIAKEPDRRYVAVRELAADIRRHLGHEPIEARPPGLAYRLVKMSRRNPTTAAVTAVTAPLLLGFAVVMSMQARRLAFERDQARELAGVMVGLYSAPYYESGRGGPRNAAEVIKSAADRIEAGMTAKPLLQARLQHAIGESLRASGHPVDAIPLLESSRQRLAALSGEGDPDALEAGASLARALADADRFEASEREFLTALGGQRRKFGDESIATLRTARDLGMLYKRLGRNEASAALLGEAAEGLRRALGETAGETLVATSLAASVLLDLRRLDEAERLLVWAIPRMDAGLEERAAATYNLACVKAQRGERGEALRLLEEAVTLNFTNGFFGDSNLAPLWDDPAFIAIADEALARRPTYQATLIEWSMRAVGAGRAAEAESVFRYLLNVMPRGSGSFQGIRARLRDLLVYQHRYAEALPLMEEEVADLRGKGPADRETLAFRLGTLANLRVALGDIVGGVAAIDEAILLWQGRRGDTRVAYLQAVRAAALGDLDQAERTFEEAVDRGLVDVGLLRDGVVLRRLEGRPHFERARARLRQRRGRLADRFTTWWGQPLEALEREIGKHHQSGGAQAEVARTGSAER